MKPNQPLSRAKLQTLVSCCGVKLNPPNSRKLLNEYSLSDGGCIEAPESDTGLIRRRDKDGNTEELRRIGEDGWQDWADLFDAKASDFT